MVWKHSSLLFFFVIAEMFTEAVCKFSPCFLLCRFFTLCTGYAVDDIGGDAFKLIIDVAGSFIFECRAKRFLFEDFYGFLYLQFVC